MAYYFFLLPCNNMLCMFLLHLRRFRRRGEIINIRRPKNQMHAFVTGRLLWRPDTVDLNSTTWSTVGAALLPRHRKHRLLKPSTFSTLRPTNGRLKHRRRTMKRKHTGTPVDHQVSDSRTGTRLWCKTFLGARGIHWPVYILIDAFWTNSF